MNKKYLEKIASVEGKSIESYKAYGLKTPDILISSAILFCLLEGISQVESVAKEIEETPERVKIVLDNLIASGYINNNKIVFHIKNGAEEEWKKEYYLFSIAGTGILKKV